MNVNMFFWHKELISLQNIASGSKVTTYTYITQGTCCSTCWFDTYSTVCQAEEGPKSGTTRMVYQGNGWNNTGVTPIDP